MKKLLGRWADPRFRRLYLSVLSKMVESACAPFWWSVAGPKDTASRILHNGTISYVNTGSRYLVVAADHVYQQYLDDVEEYGAAAIECQFAGSTIYPETRAIARSKTWDIATVAVPEVFVGASQRNPKTHHHALQWPPTRAERSEAVMYGGFPGILREEKGHVAELPFQWAASRVTDVTDRNIVLEPNFQTMEWQGTEANDNPFGWSGGPVFRSVEGGLIARLELIGFICQFPCEQAVLARHADIVLSDGNLR